MPVLVTGAHRPLARTIATELLERGGEVRAHGSGDLGSLRAAGAIAAVGDGDDEGHLDASLADVHTAVHVGRGVLAPAPEVLIAEALTLARAAENAGVRRIVALGVPGADRRAADPLRAAAGEVEAILAGCSVPTVVLRTSVVDTPAIRDALATAGLSPQEREREVAPVRTDDVAALVGVFDDLRGTSASGHAVLLADGPTSTTIDGWFDRVGVARPGAGSLVGRRALDPARVPMLLPSLQGPWTSRADRGTYPDAWTFAALTPRMPGLR